MLIAAGPALAGVLFCGLVAILTEIMWSVRDLPTRLASGQPNIRQTPDNIRQAPTLRHAEPDLPREIHPISQSGGTYTYRYKNKLYDDRFKVMAAYQADHPTE